MTAADLVAALSSGPGNALVWLLVLVIGVPVLGSIKSEKYGIFSLVGRSYQEWKEHVIREDEATGSTRVALLESRLEDLQAEVERQAAAIDALETREDLQHRYILYCTNWARGVEKAAAAAGFGLPQAFRSYADWVRLEQK